MKVVLRWLHGWLTQWLEGGDYKRRDKLVKKKGKALSIFDNMKNHLRDVAVDLDDEAIMCDAIVIQKTTEIEVEAANAKDARDERDRIKVTCTKIDELLGESTG